MPPIKKEILNIVLFHEIARYLAEHLKMEILTNCLVHGNSFARSIRKNSKIPKKRKMSKLIQTRSPFISYCKEEPAQETQTSCCFP